MNDKKYKDFLKIYDSLADEILEEKVPNKVVELIENNFRRLDNSFKAATPYLQSTNEILDNKELEDVQYEITCEVGRIRSKLLHKEADMNKVYRIKDGMKRILDNFYLYHQELDSILNGTKDYLPNNQDYINIIDEYRLKNESKNENFSGNDLFRGIVFSTNTFRFQFFELISKRVAVENKYLLDQLLLGKKINGKIIFTGKVELFCFYFAYPFQKGLITIDREVLLWWLVGNFRINSGKKVIDANYSTLNTKIKSKIDKINNPEPKTKFINEIKELVDSYLKV